jgi:iron(III) transport system substrate-binding protein
MKSAKTWLAGTLAAIAMAPPLAIAAVGDVNVYSYRQPYLIEPLMQAFTEETGIEVNVVFSESGIAQRLEREGRNSPADVVLTVDIARLDELVQKDLTQPVQSEILEQNIPAEYRHPEGRWFGLTRRVRAIYSSQDRVDEGAITTYGQLADERWNDRICTRSGKHPYNVALTASMIAHHGEEKAQQWLEGLKSNLARKPQGGDRDQIRAIAEGVCDVALGNSYYYGVMLSDPEQKEQAEAARIIFPDQGSRGAHVNLSGAAVAKHAPNRENALAFLEFLASDQAQQMYADMNYEYPVKEDIQPTGIVAEWGEFKADDLPLDEIAKYREEAVKMADRVGYDN